MAEITNLGLLGAGVIGGIGLGIGNGIGTTLGQWIAKSHIINRIEKGKEGEESCKAK